jgi:hypothetical protein
MVHKEEFMRGIKSFLEEKLPEMLDYIHVVSTPGPEDSPQPQSEAHVRSRAIRALHDRKRAMSDLQKELIPHEQHFLDVPRHLAIITSAIVRHSRNDFPEDPAIADLYNRCRDVERHALYYVSRHAALHGGGSVARPFPTSELSRSPTTSSYGPTEPPSSPPTKSRTSSLHSRSKTAPSGAMSDSALHTVSGSRRSQEYPLSRSELSASGEPGAELSKEDRDESWGMSRRQASRPRSVSTDSIPNPRDTGSGETNTTVEALRPRNAERKKGFLRNILNRR